MCLFMGLDQNMIFWKNSQKKNLLICLLLQLMDFRNIFLYDIFLKAYTNLLVVIQNNFIKKKLVSLLFYYNLYLIRY